MLWDFTLRVEIPLRPLLLAPSSTEVLMWLWLAALAAAQDDASRFNTQLVRPTFDAEGTLWTEDTRSRPDGYASVRSFLHYAHAPFRYVNEFGVERPVASLAELDVLASAHFKNLRLGVHAPLYLYAGSAVTTDGAGLGDLALDLRGVLLQREQHPVGLALGGRLLLPTASVAPWVGADGIGWELLGVVDRRFGNLLVAANLGTRGVPDASYADLVWNDQVFARIGTVYHLPADAGLSAEIGLQTNWASRYNPAGTPAEALVGGFLPLPGSMVLRGAVGPGLSRSPGAPVVRGLLGVSFEPDPYPDRDLDGIVDREDRCPLDPEDSDGFADEDGCVDPAVWVKFDLDDDEGAPVEGVVVSVRGPEVAELSGERLEAQLHPGTYQIVATAEGYASFTQEVVVPEGERLLVEGELPALRGGLKVWAVDAAGQPVASAEVVVSGGEAQPADGRPQSLAVGEHSVLVRAPGFQAASVSLGIGRGEMREYTAVLSGTGGPKKVDLRSDRLAISERVHFELNQAVIAPSSYGLLDEIAAVLLAHPEISRVEVAGHTDSRGAASANLKLSAERAEAVRAYLVRQGVASSRLRSVGYGETRPVDRRDVASAHEANRRVEFNILERDR